MEIRATSGYIYLGTAVRYLMDLDTGAQIHGDSLVLQNIDELQRFLVEYEFHVTRQVATSLISLRDEWAAEAAEHANDADWPSSRLLSDAECEKVVEASKTIRETMLAEGWGKVSFIASDKRYTVKKLLDDVGSLMGHQVFEGLPDIAQYDFKEGGQAIAFDLPTAGAFHILRGTEAVLRDFYSRVVKRERIKEPRMWAAMVSHLRSRRNAPPALLLDNLDSLRSNFRNPTQHPDKTYDIDEVQDLLAISIDSVNRMAKYLTEKSL